MVTVAFCLLPKSDDLPSGVGLGVRGFGRVEATHVMADLGRLRHQIRQELLDVLLLAQGLVVLKRFGTVDYLLQEKKEMKKCENYPRHETIFHMYAKAQESLPFKKFGY